jgi:hypothetical protein
MTNENTKKLIKAIETLLKAHEARVAEKINAKIQESELIFSIECLLDSKVSEGRKTNN